MNSIPNQVKEALIKRRGDWATIAAAADVSISWLSKFVNGHIEDPSYGRITRLHEMLCRRKCKRRANV